VYLWISNVLLNHRILARALWPLKVKRDCIVDKSLKIIKLIKNAVRSILDNFGIVSFLVFGRIPVDLSHFSLHFDSILSPNYFILKVLKCSFNKRNCIVDKSLKIIKLIKNAVRLKYNMNMKYNPVSHSDSVTKFQGIL
jgi:hypothetical protein